MKRLSTRLLWPVLACVTLSPLAAESPDLKDLLRDALYKEEVNRDPEAAAKAYQTLLTQNDAERAFAATAQFRLAEVRRKQGRKDDAIAAYRVLLARYPEAETECKLARENLIGLGASDASAPGNPTSPQQPPAEGYDESGQKLTPAQIHSRQDKNYLATLQDMAAKSPDKLGERENFEKAISSGYAESLTFLLQKAVLSEQVPLLTMAVKSGSLEMVKLVLKGKAPIGADERKEVLSLAAAMNQLYIAQELLAQGFDINASPDSTLNMLPAVAAPNQEQRFPILGSPLTTAIGYRNTKLVELLLKSNPDPNARGEQHQGWDKGLTSLNVAILVKDMDLVKELLACGADPNLKSDRSGPNSGRDWASLDFAIEGGVMEAVPLLVKAGGRMTQNNLLIEVSPQSPRESNSLKPAVELLLNSGMNAGDLPDPVQTFSLATPEQAKMMLAHGLDPNLVTKGQSILDWIVSTKKWDLAQMLLDAGAKPEPPASGSDANSPLSVLAVAAYRFAPLDFLEKLMSKGATLESTWSDQGFYIPGNRSGSNYVDTKMAAGTRSILFRRFGLPSLPASEDVRVLYHDNSNSLIATLQQKSPSPKPSSLEQLLISPALPVDWTVGKGGLGPEKITVWRAGPDGSQRVALEADMRQESAFPALEWGDLVELTYRPDDEDAFNSDHQPERQLRLPDQVTWKVRQRIAVPVTVEVDGKAQELTLRGDQVIFDPTRREAPLMGAAQLARIFSRQAPGLSPPTTVTVVRPGWPEVGVSFDSQPDVDFTLAPGDRVKWGMLPMLPESSPRAGDITVYSPGLPFAVIFPNYGLSDMSSPTEPSLLQALATAYAPDQSALKLALTGSAEDLDGWLAGGFGHKALSILPHPDFARIRIHRRQGESESVIDVDLQKTIDALSPQANSAEAKAADVILKPGDRVELPVLPDSAGKPWAGFTAAQTAFLEKALSCTVQYTSQDQGVALRNVLYHPPRFTPTPGGLVPLPSLQGDSSLRASDLLGPDSVTFISEGRKITLDDSYNVFLSERFQYQYEQAPMQGGQLRRPVPAPPAPGVPAHAAPRQNPPRLRVPSSQPRR